MLNSLHLLKQLIQEIAFARDADKPCSRFFFTKESKIMCLLNIVLLCGLKCHVTPAEIKELDYLTQIVFELYERKGVENEVMSNNDTNVSIRYVSSFPQGHITGI
jgi:inositol hexakisphosphate/diphosphoinositol-pentakisphosphate kinase